MASLVVLAPTVNKSSNMISPAATVVPRKKALPAGGVRNRFAKPKPNVRPLANKGPKETPNPTKENVSTSQEDPKTNEASQETLPPVKVEPETASEALTIAGASANETSEETVPVKEEVSSSQEEPKSEKVSPETSSVKVEAPAEVKPRTHPESPVKSRLASESSKEAPKPIKDEEVSTSQEEPKPQEVFLETPPPVKVNPQTPVGGLTTSQSPKAIPDVGAVANKSSNEAPKHEKEEVSAPQEKHKSNEVSQETPAPAEVKAKTTPGVLSRRRTLKPAPKIIAKNAPRPGKEKVSTSQEETKQQEVSLETPPPVEVNPQTPVGGLTTSKSPKGIPDVGALANKSSNEAPKPEKEEVSAPQEEHKSNEVSQETPAPAEVKAKTTPGVLSRRRTLKPAPKIIAKNAPRPGKEKVSSSQEEPKPQEVSLKTPPPVEVNPQTPVGGLTTSKSPKAIPDVGALANKSSNEDPKPEKEEVSAPQEELQSKEVSQNIPAPAGVKAKAIPGVLSRRRPLKIQPKISAREAPRPGKEKASVLQEDPKSKKVSKETTPPVEVGPKTVEEKTPDVCEEVAKEVSSSSVLSVQVPENEHPVKDVLPAAENAVVSLPDAIEKFPVEKTCSSENVAENTSSITATTNEVSPRLGEKRLDSPFLSRDISPPNPPTTTVAKTPAVTPPDANLAVVPARVNTPGVTIPPAAHKTSSKPEYPTLKGLLNSSPRKRNLKKNNERKKRFANGAEPPPRSEMTIADLIYFNPVGTAVTVKKQNTCTVVAPIEQSIEPVPDKPEEEEEPAVLGPQVMINEKGEIVLNEASLLVKRKDTVDHSAPAVIEDENTTYASFRFKASRQWTKKETTKFYKALKLVGTDFALMEKIFEVGGKVTRTRKELKCKYKREERLHTVLVNQCIYDTQTFEISILENESEEEPDDPVVEKKKTRGRKKKKDASPEPVSRSEYVSTSEQSDEQNENGSELSLVPSDVKSAAEGLLEISVQINSELYHSAENDGSESPAEYAANVELSTAEHQNGETLPVKKRGRKRKIRVIPDSAESSSWEDTSEIYHFPDVAKKSRKARANVIVSSADESQGDPTERVFLSDKNVQNAVELPEHGTTTDNLCMDAAISEVSTTRRGRKKKVALTMPSFSSFTPAEENDEEQRPQMEEEEVVSMEVDVDSLTTRQERRKKVVTPMPSFSNFTPAEEVIEVGDEAQCLLVEESEEEVASMEVTVDSPDESLQSDATQPAANVGPVAMEVAGGPSVSMSPHHTPSVIKVANGMDVVDGGEQRYFLTQASDSDNVVHVFVVKSGEQVPLHPS